jgi:hypothetical protein
MSLPVATKMPDQTESGNPLDFEKAILFGLKGPLQGYEPQYTTFLRIA